MKTTSAPRAALARLAAAACLVLPGLAVLAQDIPGIEVCTHESRMDRRTGCLQSDVDFLQREVTKNALDAEARSAAQGREIAALRQQLSAASLEAAALREALAALQARIAQFETARRERDGRRGP